MSRVVWSRQAVADLEAIREFIARDSAQYAAAMVERLTSATDRLQQFPQSGRIVPEVGDPELRELLVGSYRVIYRTRDPLFMAVLMRLAAQPDKLTSKQVASIAVRQRRMWPPCLERIENQVTASIEPSPSSALAPYSATS